MSQKDQRIIKLHNKGLDNMQIARKIGYGGNMLDGVKRVIETLEKNKS